VPLDSPSRGTIALQETGGVDRWVERKFTAERYPRGTRVAEDPSSRFRRQTAIIRDPASKMSSSRGGARRGAKVRRAPASSRVIAAANASAPSAASRSRAATARTPPCATGEAMAVPAAPWSIPRRTQLDDYHGLVKSATAAALAGAVASSAHSC
jgi:hypothetical protein